MSKEESLEENHPAALKSSPASGNNLELGLESCTVDWDGLDDAENPVNWPAAKRWAQIVMISILGFITYALLPTA